MFCQWKTEGHTFAHHVCPYQKQVEIIQWFLEQEYDSLLMMTPCDLFNVIYGRTLWLIGDSQMRTLHVALQCFLSEFWNLTEEPVSNNPKTLTEWQTALSANTIHGVPTCEGLLQDTRVCFVESLLGNETVKNTLPVLYNGNVQSKDIILINFGLWHHDELSYKAALGSFASLTASLKRQCPNIFWKDTPPQHFDTPSGSWRSGLGKPPFRCRQIQGVELQKDHSLSTARAEQQLIVEGGWRNKAAKSVLQPYMPIVESWNDTVPLWKFHRDNVMQGYECSHYCHPSASEVWIFNLYNTLKNSKLFL